MRKARQGRTERVEQGKVEQPEMFEGKPRYLVLSDGQILDRANQPKPNKRC